jgi:ribosome-binding factor A
VAKGDSMNMRLSRVEQTLRRALAEILLRGDLRDPRLRNAAAISITAVKISPDLGQAQVYVDVLRDQVSLPEVLAGLNAGASALRAKLGKLIHLKRTPSLRFVVDRSIEQGYKIEAVLAELHTKEAAADSAPSEDGTEIEPDDLEPDEPESDDLESDEPESDEPESDEPEPHGVR